MSTLFHTRRRLLSHGIENMLRIMAALDTIKPDQNHSDPIQIEPALKDSHNNKAYSHPEDYKPLDPEFFSNPYDFYQLLRDEYPVYQLSNGIYCVSRYDDIVTVCRDTENYSSSYQGIIPGLKKGASIERAGKALDKVGELGVAPSNVLALSDPPRHSCERKVSATGLNTGFAKHLDEEITLLTHQLLDELIIPNQNNTLEFMEDFAWKVPMQIVMKLLGYPTEDYDKIKALCCDVISLQTGVASPAELKKYQSSSLALMRYCWKQYHIAKKNLSQHKDNATGVFIRAVSDENNHLTDQLAVSSIFQTLIAGSDSSATSMGNAVKMLIENPEVEQQLRNDPDKTIPNFVEEVFRLEAAFQGHFRWTKKDVTLNGTLLPRGSRIFLIWASANRDATIFPNPNIIDLQRPNAKKHMTFGFGLHACAGRELARKELYIALNMLLNRSHHMKIVGETPYEESMFTHSLKRLPLMVQG